MQPTFLIRMNTDHALHCPTGNQAVGGSASFCRAAPAGTRFECFALEVTSVSFCFEPMGLHHSSDPTQLGRDTLNLIAGFHQNSTVKDFTQSSHSALLPQTRSMLESPKWFFRTSLKCGQFHQSDVTKKSVAGGRQCTNHFHVTFKR